MEAWRHWTRMNGCLSAMVAGDANRLLPGQRAGASKQACACSLVSGASGCACLAGMRKRDGASRKEHMARRERGAASAC